MAGRTSPTGEQQRVPQAQVVQQQQAQKASATSNPETLRVASTQAPRPAGHSQEVTREQAAASSVSPQQPEASPAH